MQTTTSRLASGNDQVTSYGDLTIHAINPDRPDHTVCGKVHSSRLHDGDERLGWFSRCAGCFEPPMFEVKLTDQPDHDRGALFGVTADMPADERPVAEEPTPKQPGSGIAQTAWQPSLVQVGDWITGRCVTMNSTYTGRVAEVHGPIRTPDCGGYRYKLVDTGHFYATGGPVEPTVFARTWATAADAQCPVERECVLNLNHFGLCSPVDNRYPAASTGANPLVMITNDLGDIEHVRRDVFTEHYEPFGWWITAPTAAPDRRNAKVTDRARVLADFIDAHTDLGDVCSLDAQTYGDDKLVRVQLTGINKHVAAAMLAWFYRLDNPTVTRSLYRQHALVHVTGNVSGIAVEVFTGFYSGDAFAALQSEPTVHTLRALQIAGAR